MSAISIISATLANVRVAGDQKSTGTPHLTYTPAHTINGKQVSQKVKFSVYGNSNRGTDQRTGDPGRSDRFEINVWGKLADTCCKALSVGKELSLICRPQSYLGRLFNTDGTLRLDNQGQPIQVNKTSFTVTEIAFGSDATKTIEREIQEGVRPPQWNNPNSPDWQHWIDILKARMATTWDCKNAVFGYARVIDPRAGKQGVEISWDVYQQNQAAPARTQAFGDAAAVGSFTQQVMGAANGGGNSFGGPQVPMTPSGGFQPASAVAGRSLF